MQEFAYVHAPWVGGYPDINLELTSRKRRVGTYTKHPNIRRTVKNRGWAFTRYWALTRYTTVCTVWLFDDSGDVGGA